MKSRLACFGLSVHIANPLDDTGQDQPGGDPSAAAQFAFALALVFVQLGRVVAAVGHANGRAQAVG